MTKAIVIAGSSDIGTAAINQWLDLGWDVSSTYRVWSNAVDKMDDRHARMIHCNLDSWPSVYTATSWLIKNSPNWDVLMLCPATMNPIAPFLECDWDSWEKSVYLNFTVQMKILHTLLPYRNAERHKHPPMVFLWAGPGTNDAPVNYSAEIVSKISQIKMCELLDAEIPDCRFVIVGPGWVNTKIHKETIRAGHMAGDNLQRTVDMTTSDKCTPTQHVVDFLMWALDQEKSVVSGRNFSVPNDIWGNASLTDKLARTPNAFKLRRHLNDWREDME